MEKNFLPTCDQARIIDHEGSAFVSACPGSGKTQVMVERARSLLTSSSPGRGIAFLSFTSAAVSELERRLRIEGLLPYPPFPNFLGTFDSFLWQFVVIPLRNSDGAPPIRLIPDIGRITVQPAESLPKLSLDCFDRTSGRIVPRDARRMGFDPDSNLSRTTAYETTAAKIRAALLQRRQIDFEEARSLAAESLRDAAISSPLRAALACRFREVIVDEAQDCNPADLEIVKWLRESGISTKVVCDPNQSIYGFRGGVTDELIAFEEEFGAEDRLRLSGNFRSSEPISKGIAALRPLDARGDPDSALGRNSSITTPIHILSYPGSRVPANVAGKFGDLVEAQGLCRDDSPVLAATRNTIAAAMGQPKSTETRHLTLRLAHAVTGFHYSFETKNRLADLEEVHRVVLDIEGHIGQATYHQYLSDKSIDAVDWRPRILRLVRELRYDPSAFASPDAWLEKAKELLEPGAANDGSSISQKLRRHQKLAATLAEAPQQIPPAHTIHAVKGMQFPAVCVVTTAATLKGILDFLTKGESAGRDEEARKLYVAASRAQQFLAIASPRSQAKRLAAHLRSTGAAVVVVDL